MELEKEVSDLHLQLRTLRAETAGSASPPLQDKKVHSPPRIHLNKMHDDMLLYIRIDRCILRILIDQGAELWIRKQTEGSAVIPAETLLLWTGENIPPAAAARSGIQH